MLDLWAPFGQAEHPSIHTKVRAGKGKLAPAGLPAASLGFEAKGGGSEVKV